MKTFEFSVSDFVYKPTNKHATVQMNAQNMHDIVDLVMLNAIFFIHLFICCDSSGGNAAGAQIVYIEIHRNCFI